MTLLVCSFIALYASEAAQDDHDYVSARVQMHIGESVAADLPTNLIEQAAEVLDVLGANETIEKQFVELHAPLWAGTPTAEYLKAVAPAHEKIAEALPAVQDALNRFTVALQKQYGSRWGTWAKRAAIVAAVAGAVVLLRKWWLKRQARIAGEATTVDEVDESAARDRFGDAGYDMLRGAALRLRHRLKKENREVETFVVQPDGSAGASIFSRAAAIIKDIPALSASEYARRLQGEEAAQFPGNESVPYGELVERELNKKLPGFSFLRDKKVSTVLIFINEREGIVIKVPNPHAKYVYNTGFKEHGLRGANHSLRRDVRRVLRAQEITDRFGDLNIFGVGSRLLRRPLDFHPEEKSLNSRTALIAEEFVPGVNFRGGNPISDGLTDDQVDALCQVPAILDTADVHEGNLIRLEDGRVIIFDTERPHAAHKPRNAEWPFLKRAMPGVQRVFDNERAARAAAR